MVCRSDDSGPVVKWHLPAGLTAAMPTALATALLLSVSASASPAPDNAAVAARNAQRLGCHAFAYEPGNNSVSGSRGQLDCHLARQDFIVYVFSSNRERAMGIAQVKLWSGPDEVYFFVRDNRVVIAAQGDDSKPAYTRKWARWAARRTGGAVFSG